MWIDFIEISISVKISRTEFSEKKYFQVSVIILVLMEKNPFIQKYIEIDDKFFWLESVNKDPYYHIADGLNIIYPGSSFPQPFARDLDENGYQWEWKTRYLSHHVHINPLLFFPRCEAHLWGQGWLSFRGLAKKYHYGLWKLYLCYLPILNDLKLRIYYILGYLTFYPIDLRIVVQSKQELQKAIDPLYRLAKGLEPKEK